MLTPPALMQEVEVRPARLAINPAACLAVLGAAILAFQLYVLAKWVTGPYFVSTPTGPDQIAPWQHTYFLALQIVVPALAILMLWNWMIRPWLRTAPETALVSWAPVNTIEPDPSGLIK